MLGAAQGLSTSDKLPFDQPLTTYSEAGQVQVSSGVIKGTHDLIAPLDKDWHPVPGNQAQIERFEVPAGMRLLHISVERLQAGSTYGKALRVCRENVQDFYLIDSKGKEYCPVGLYAMADLQGKKTFELIYLDETEREMARLPKPTKIHRDDLRNEYALVYLFHVPPGTRPKEVHTGGHAVELTQFNYVVP